jgi:histidine triad (HIT) family protein
MSCLFCRIVAGEIPAAKVYEDDELLAFKDIHPKAPLHLLIIPKEHIESMAALEDRHAPLMGRMMVLAQRLAAENGSPEGFRAVVNTGRVGRQEVYHLHMHLLGGPEPLGSSASF